MSLRTHKIYQIAQERFTSWGTHGILLILMVAMAWVVVTRPSIHGNDGVQNYVYLRSLMFDGNLDFSNEYEYFISRQAEWFDHKQIPRDPVTDLPINLYGVGNSLLWAPWVFLFHGGGWVANQLGADLTLDGFSTLYARAVGFGSAFYASVGLLLLFRTLAAMRGTAAAAWAVMLVWLTSPLFFYMYLHPSMSHANSFFLSALLLSLYLRWVPGEAEGDTSPDRQSLWKWTAMGAVGGLMVLTRYQDGILLLGLLVGELWLWSRADGSKLRWIARRAGRYAVWLVAFGLVLTPQLFAWKYLQGSWFSGPRAYVQQGSFSFLAPAYAPQVLFSSKHGLFYWHPSLMMAVAGLLMAGTYLREKLMALACFAGQVWVVASWSIWWAGASFGHRMFISTLPFLAIGAVFTVGRNDRIGFICKVLMMALIAWNFGCIVQYGLGWIPRQDGVPLSVLAHNNFVRIPMLLIGRAE